VTRRPPPLALRPLWLLAVSFLTIPAPAPADETALPGWGEDVGRTVVYRDAWGVPHIYAPTMEAAVYAQGWAQAEDRPTELLLNFLRARGEAARVLGPEAVAHDVVARTWDHRGVAERRADTIRPEVRRHLRAFARGINAWYAAHPEDVPDWWDGRRVDEHDVIAFGRLFLYAWSIEQAFGDLERIGVEPGAGEFHHGSNQWAVAPDRSAEGAAILLIDPHLSWWGLSRFWEFRVHAGDWHGSGFTLPGSPYIGLGHTRHVAWAMTTGGPDTADVYELELHPEDPTRYRWEDGWRELAVREIAIEVKGAEAPLRRRVVSSHHGPVIAVRGGRAFAARTAYADTVGTSETWHDLNRARDHREAMEALATLQLFPQNVMLADTDGHIYYQRTGRTPRRPEGFDWSRPVDGTTAETEWLGIHPASDLVQILDPPSGWMQNTNVPPASMFPASPLTPERYPEWVYSDRGYGPLAGWTNDRGARAVEILSADASVTAEEARAYALDVRPYGAARWQEALRAAHARFGAAREGQPLYRTGLERILDWDGALRRDSQGALAYSAWRRQLREDLGREAALLAARIDFLMAALGEPRPERLLGEAAARALVDAVGPAMARLRQQHGTLDAVYGDRYRVGRGDRSWPVGGGGSRRLGLRTLRSVGFDRERPDHTRWGDSGQTSTQVVVLSSPPRSWSAMPTGQSDRPDSPHYTDQAEKLFSPRRLKPTRWRPEDLAGHAASRTVLPDAPGTYTLHLEEHSDTRVRIEVR